MSYQSALSTISDDMGLAGLAKDSIPVKDMRDLTAAVAPAFGAFQEEVHA